MDGVRATSDLHVAPNRHPCGTKTDECISIQHLVILMQLVITWAAWDEEGGAVYLTVTSPTKVSSFERT